MIRPFKISDKEQLVEILKLNTPKYFDLEEVKDYEDYLARHHETYLTIEHANKIVGGTGYYINESDGSGHIKWIFFHPGSARQGLGREVVEHCMSILRSHPGVKKLIVATSQLAYQFFEKFGYKLVKTEKDYWAKGLDLYQMEQT